MLSKMDFNLKSAPRRSAARPIGCRGHVKITNCRSICYDMPLYASSKWTMPTEHPRLLDASLSWLTDKGARGLWVSSIRASLLGIERSLQVELFIADVNCGKISWFNTRAVPENALLRLADKNSSDFNATEMEMEHAQSGYCSNTFSWKVFLMQFSSRNEETLVKQLRNKLPNGTWQNVKTTSRCRHKLILQKRGTDSLFPGFHVANFECEENVLVGKCGKAGANV